MNAMYAKLFSRIAQSSLMEQDVDVRYCFMMMLAIADPVGDVIGTDIAIARTVNLPLADFKRCIKVLMEPDPDSNSQAHDGRRVIASENGRGYQLVNYVTYREIKTIEEKRTYMREYMRKRRGSLKDKDVTSVKKCKEALSDVTHAEAEAEAEAEVPNTPNPKPAASASPPLGEGFEKFWKLYPRKEAKADALKAWRKVKPSDVVAILAAVPIHTQSVGWQKEDGRFIPLPASWLNARRWEDELKAAILSDVKPAQTDYEDPPFLTSDEAVFHKP